VPVSHKRDIISPETFTKRCAYTYDFIVELMLTMVANEEFGVISIVLISPPKVIYAELFCVKKYKV
jgi:hypothetical protein